MAIVDFVFVVILGGFVLFGLWFGLIHTLGSLLGTIVGVYLASRWYEGIAVWASNSFAGSINVWNFITFVLLFLLINRLIGFLFHLFERAFDLLGSVPFLKSINRMAGAILGAVEGAVVLGAIVFIANRFPFGFEEKVLATSKLKLYFLQVFDVLMPLVPEALKAADQIIK